MVTNIIAAAAAAAMCDIFRPSATLDAETTCPCELISVLMVIANTPFGPSEAKLTATTRGYPEEIRYTRPWRRCGDFMRALVIGHVHLGTIADIQSDAVVVSGAYRYSVLIQTSVKALL